MSLCMENIRISRTMNLMPHLYASHAVLLPVRRLSALFYLLDHHTSSLILRLKWSFLLFNIFLFVWNVSYFSISAKEFYIYAATRLSTQMVL